MVKVDLVLIIAILISGMFITFKTGKLTILAALIGGILGLFIFLGAGYGGIIMMATFFILGTIATSWKLNKKSALGLAEKDKGKRRAGQVIANGGLAGILGLLAWLSPVNANPLRVMIAACFASATADTLSSELGNLYGRKFYNVLTFKKDTRGLNGVVSAEGTLIGIIGSVIIAMIYLVAFGWSGAVILIIVAGTIGNISDSVLGATLERRNYLNNDTVNFLNTAVAAFTAYLVYSVF